MCSASPAKAAFRPAKAWRRWLRNLQRRRAWLGRQPVAAILALLDDFSGRVLRDPRTKSLEGVMFLSAWLRQSNLQKLVQVNTGGQPGFLNGFLPQEQHLMAAKPQGLVAMWMAGNVATLPMFSLAPGLLAKNVCLVKLAAADPVGMDRLLAVLGESEAGSLRGGVARRRGGRLVRLSQSPLERGNVAGRRRPRRLGRT